ncbi:metallophosphoesterase family protein [Pseudonocardia sp.]|uniref:metallophosphoesterase family protein n=1 Tax=Pseudonocardia sp. TaxID=60912 RepID=UPI003D0D9E34
MELPRHTLVHLTDLHVEVDGAASRFGFDSGPLVERALQVVAESGLRPSALVITGDLVEHGRPEEYHRLRTLAKPWITRIGAPVAWVAGNHDDRAALREHLLGEPAGTEPLDHIVWVGDLRIAVLDTTVPGLPYGELSQGQLDRLRAELAHPAPDGTVLALHHPPLPTPSQLSQLMRLRNRHELAAAIAGTDVRIALAGHTHVVSAGALAGVPIWTGGAATLLADPLPPGRGGRGLRSATLSRIDLFDDDVIVSSVPIEAEPTPARSAAEVDVYIAEVTAELAAGRPPSVPDQGSRPAGGVLTDAGGHRLPAEAFDLPGEVTAQPP